VKDAQEGEPSHRGGPGRKTAYRRTERPRRGDISSTSDGVRYWKKKGKKWTAKCTSREKGFEKGESFLGSGTKQHRKSKTARLEKPKRTGAEKGVPLLTESPDRKGPD